jgi:hypothetical protein
VVEKAAKELKEVKEETGEKINRCSPSRELYAHKIPNLPLEVAIEILRTNSSILSVPPSFCAYKRRRPSSYDSSAQMSRFSR